MERNGGAHRRAALGFMGEAEDLSEPPSSSRDPAQTQRQSFVDGRWDFFFEVHLG